MGCILLFGWCFSAPNPNLNRNLNLNDEEIKIRITIKIKKSTLISGMRLVPIGRISVPGRVGALK